MNITSQNVGKVSLELTVVIEKADYQAEVDKELKKLRANAQMPGFRKGMVPASLVKKMYGNSVVAEVVNKKLNESLFNYIKENKINMLGEPLPNEEKQKQLNFETDDKLEFVFDVALAPEFDVKLDAKDKIDFYNIEVTDDKVESFINMYRQNAGKYEQAEECVEGDMIKGNLVQVDKKGKEVAEGIKVENAVLMPKFMKNDKQKALFVGKKVNEEVVFNPNKAYDGHETEIASLLKLKKEEVAGLKDDFKFTITEITRFTMADINQDLFDATFGKDAVKTEEEYRAKVKEQIAKQYESESNFKFLIDLRKYATNKVGKLEFPEDLLKKILVLNNPDKGAEFAEEQYQGSIDELVWHLIKEKLVAQYDIKVEKEDLEAMAQEYTRMQLAQYGMTNAPQEIVENYAKEMLKKKENIQNLTSRAVDTKIANAVKETVKLVEKKVTEEEFGKLFE